MAQYESQLPYAQHPMQYWFIPQQFEALCFAAAQQMLLLIAYDTPRQLAMPPQ